MAFSLIVYFPEQLWKFLLLCIGCFGTFFGRAIKGIFWLVIFNVLISWHLKHLLFYHFSDFINSIATNTKPHCTIKLFPTLIFYSTSSANQFSNSKLFKLIFVIIFETQKNAILFPFLWLVWLINLSFQ